MTCLYFGSQKNFCCGILSEKAVVKSNAETVLACAPTLTEVTLVNLLVEFYDKSFNYNSKKKTALL